VVVGGAQGLFRHAGSALPSDEAAPAFVHTDADADASLSIQISISEATQS
jgi:hypothetical protein